jgi:Na+/proline symporter
MNLPNGAPLLGIIVIAIPLIIYIVGALSVARREIKHPDDFFVAYRKVGVTAFSSSSIAYAFQVSTVYPFLLWGEHLTSISSQR